MSIHEIWNQSLEIIKNEITEVSYNTWIKSMEPITIDDTTFTFLTSDFNRGILIDRYVVLISNAIKQVTSKEFKIVILTANELPSSTTNNKSLNNNDKNDLIKKSNLNPRYVFNEFVIGANNRFAHAGSLAVAETPAKAYNPLFIYGGVGLGKTHLMHAIGHFVKNHNSDANIIYVTSEKFTNEFIDSIKDDKNTEFRNKYRKADILLVDDIQFIAGKERTQEEFFHTFNTLYEDNKQIVLTSDRAPKEIPTLEARLRSRFEMGLITDISAPDYETRVAILRKKAERDKIDIPNDIHEFIATKIKSNIRELEGALNRVIAYASLTNRSLSVELSEEALKSLISEKKTKKITIELIRNLICKYYDLSEKDIISKKRSRNIAFPRQVAMYLSRELTDLSLPKIGEEFGGRDHTTVIHAVSKINNQINTNSIFKNEIDELMDKLNKN